MKNSIYIRYSSKKDKKNINQIKVNKGINTNSKLLKFLLDYYLTTKQNTKSKNTEIKQLKIQLEHYKNQVF
jgi:hypothetical protein